MKTIYLLALLVVLCVIGCSRITNGEVQSKKFVPQHEDTYTTYQKVGDIDIPIENTYTVPDKWYITFGKNDEDGKYKERTIEVSNSCYRRYSVGDWINFD